MAAILLVATAAPLLAPHDPMEQDLANVLAPPSWAHLIGTDYLGRDLLSRLIWASRVSLGAAALILALNLLSGSAAGLVAGMGPAWLDELLMRVADLFLSVPSLLLALALAGVRGPGFDTVLLALAIGGWPAHARLVRSVVATTRRLPFVEAAIALGGGPVHLLVRHVAPAAIGPALVLASLEAGQLLLSIAALSFLGVGIQPPTPEWGSMLADAQAYFLVAPYLVIFPGLAILVASFSLNALAERLATPSRTARA